ncbi:helix-turn-helix domain-containing protein [Polynucleobacter sp. AP-Reno-20A-A9]|uniref:helix-turn-helix domain-containing protein n=1 Tax=Polynucleobacter sp. AP-Reno-20A-A9 TaxID=2576925 RepID=UPI001C0C80CE|nr:helix-turn-helix transcriptional regulator [Polynucleobacter sp. AP-Reno-20A-A9]MBU3628000.1 helix-turn-helix transcriptional regulator [Polynucleobacter sp. AP-Reno-20A-A9]
MAKPSPTYSGSKQLVALGKTIRAIRLENGLSQEALANEIGIDRSYMGGIERGEHNVAIMNLSKIAKTLKIKASELLAAAGL